MKRTVKLVALGCILALLFAGCGAKTDNANAKTEAAVGEPLQTMFFEFTVDSAQRLDAYGEYAPAEGNAYVQVNVTLKNTSDAEIPMADGDFQLRCGEGEGAVNCWPADAVDEAMMPRSYTLAASASGSYVLLFEVPATDTAFALFTSDTYTTGAGEAQTGNTYTVRFSA